MALVDHPDVAAARQMPTLAGRVPYRRQRLDLQAPVSRHIPCFGTVNWHRPDRGPEHRCDHPARFVILLDPETPGFLACGYHRRAFTPQVSFFLAPVPR